MAAVLGDPNDQTFGGEEPEDGEEETEMDPVSAAKFASLQRTLADMEAAEEGVWGKEDFDELKVRMDRIPKTIKKK